MSLSVRYDFSQLEFIMCISMGVHFLRFFDCNICLWMHLPCAGISPLIRTLACAGRCQYLDSFLTLKQEDGVARRLLPQVSCWRLMMDFSENDLLLETCSGLFESEVQSVQCYCIAFLFMNQSWHDMSTDDLVRRVTELRPEKKKYLRDSSEQIISDGREDERTLYWRFIPRGVCYLSIRSSPWPMKRIFFIFWHEEAQIISREAHILLVTWWRSWIDTLHRAFSDDINAL